MSPEPRTRDAEATRSSILEAAETVFVEKGFADASVSEIAEMAGVTKSLIHHHFGSKEALWGEVKHHRFSEYAEVQGRILQEAEPDAELLRTSVSTYFDFLRRNPGFPRLVSWMHLEEAEDQPFDLAAQLTEPGIECIAEAQRRGELRDDVHPFYMLITFIGLAEYWFQSKDHHCQWVADQPELMDDERFHDALQKIFFEGVLPRDGSGEGEGD